MRWQICSTEEFRKGTLAHIELCYIVLHPCFLPAAGGIFCFLWTDIREESGGKIETKNLILYEPDEKTVFDAIVPEYLAGLVYGGVSAMKVPQVNWQPDVWLWTQRQVMWKR